MCTCGPLGYVAGIEDPDTGDIVESPLLETAEQARAWRRDQEWAVDPNGSASSNGNGDPRPVTRAAGPQTFSARSHTPTSTVTATAGRKQGRAADIATPRRASSR